MRPMKHAVANPIDRDMKLSRMKLFIGWIVLAAAALALASIGGCSTISTRPANSAQPRTLDELRRESKLSVAGNQRPRIALVLGGGGLRGFAHTGVIRALEEMGIEPEIVVGTSAGALVGAAYASGMRASEIESAASSLEVPALLDWTLSKSGIVRGAAIASWVNDLTRGVPIEKFPRRYAAVATDLGREVAVAIDRGDAGAAVQASAAVPGVMLPIAHEKGLLVDGGITSLVPVRFARAMGADFVLAVDIYCAGPRYSGDGALTFVYGSCKRRAAWSPRPRLLRQTSLLRRPSRLLASRRLKSNSAQYAKAMKRRSPPCAVCRLILCGAVLLAMQLHEVLEYVESRSERTYRTAAQAANEAAADTFNFDDAASRLITYLAMRDHDRHVYPVTRSGDLESRQSQIARQPGLSCPVF